MNLTKKKKQLLAIFLCGCSSMLILTIILKKESKTRRDYPQIAKEGILRIVTDYNPTGYFVSGDTISGFNNDLVQLVKTQTSLQIELSLETSLDKSIEGLHQGKYDVLARNSPITSEQRGMLAFTNLIMHNKQVLVQRTKASNKGLNPIRSHLYLAKKTLYIPKNSPAILRIRNLSHEIGDTIFYKEDDLYDNEQLIYMVASNEIDYAVCDEKTAQKLALSLPEIDYATLIGFTHLEAWAVRSDAPILCDSLNAWLGRIQKTNDYNQLYRKYYK